MAWQVPGGGAQRGPGNLNANSGNPPGRGGAVHPNHQANFNIQNRGNRFHPVNWGRGGNPGIRRVIPNVAGNQPPVWNHPIDGFGQAPRRQQQMDPRFHPYQGGQDNAEAKYDPSMTLEEALHSNWRYNETQSQRGHVGRVSSRDDNNQPAHNEAGSSHGQGSSFPALNTRQATWAFANPTEIEGEFARAMSRITRDPSSASQGSVLHPNKLNEKLFNQVQLALAVKMGLNGPQQVKERALQNVLTSRSARGDMKQVLQSRAEIYGDELDPN